jgi:choline dehydrogenase-like flavoprotein
VRAPGAARGRDRLVAGLWVADASLFPTALGVNPMITTMVMARRVARAVLAEMPRP